MVSGAAQVAMVGLLASGAAPVLLATTGLALRHIPMSAALSNLLGQTPTHHRLRLAWVLVDETFGLTVNAARDPSVDLVSFKSAADLAVYITWLEVFPTALFVALAVNGFVAPDGSLDVGPAMAAGIGGVAGAFLSKRSVLGIVGVGLVGYWAARLIWVQ